MSRYCFFIAASWGDAAVAKHFKALANLLVHRGHLVVYLTHGQQVNLDEGHLHVRSFPSRRPTKPRDFMFLDRLIRTYRPDCMIANFGAVNVMTIMGWLHKVPCRVDWYHSFSKAFELGDERSRWVRHALILRKRLVYGLASHVVAVSQATRDDLLSTYKIDMAKTHVIYNTLADPLEHLKAPSAMRPEPVVVCAGGFHPWKGQDVLIRAFSKAGRSFPHVRLELIGDGPQSSKYRQLIQEEALEDRCFLAGRLSHYQVLQKMHKSWVVVVPSRYDSFPYVVIEALAVGVPVIASQVGGIPEAVRDGQDGFLVPPDDPQALADRLRLILSDPALRDQMGQNARRHFLECFEQRANIVKQADWFEALVASSK